MLTEILKNLEDSDRESLMVAFEGDFEAAISLDDGIVLGVNLNTDDYDIIECRGSFCLARKR